MMNISRDGPHLSAQADWLLQFQISAGEAEDSAGVEEEPEQWLAQPRPGCESESGGEEEKTG